MSGWLLLIAGVVTIAAIYAMLSLALNIEGGIAGLWDLGIVSFFGVGAYTYVILTAGPPGPQHKYLYGLGLPLWAGFVAAGVVGALFAYLIGLPSLKLRHEYFLITTLAFAEVTRELLTNEAWLTNGVAGMYRLPQPFRPYFSANGYQLFFAVLMLAMLAVVFWVARRVLRSPFGRTLKALRENELVAMSAGKDVFRFRLKAFVLSGALAAMAGPAYVWYGTLVVPHQFSSDITFTVWTALVLGGIGNNIGAVAGAFFLVVAQESLRFLQVDAQMALVLANLRVALLGAILILVMRFMPQGLIPERQLKL